MMPIPANWPVLYSLSFGPCIAITPAVISVFGGSTAGVNSRWSRTPKSTGNYGLSFYHHSVGAGVARVFNQRSNNPLHIRTVRLVSVVNELKVGGVDIGSIANSHCQIESDPLLEGEVCSCAGCNKREEDKPKHCIAEKNFVTTPAAAMFLGLWLGLRQSGWLLLFGVVWVISGRNIFVFHALLPSVLRNWLRRTAPLLAAPHACCGVVSNGCCDVSALRGVAFMVSAPPLPPPKPAIACTS